MSMTSLYKLLTQKCIFLNSTKISLGAISGCLAVTEQIFLRFKFFICTNLLGHAHNKRILLSDLSHTVTSPCNRGANHSDVFVLGTYLFVAGPICVYQNHHNTARQGAFVYNNRRGKLALLAAKRTKKKQT